jgi:hypothetical protein
VLGNNADGKFSEIVFALPFVEDWEISTIYMQLLAWDKEYAVYICFVAWVIEEIAKDKLIVKPISNQMRTQQT